jgi:hypothetical protein
VYWVGDGERAGLFITILGKEERYSNYVTLVEYSETIWFEEDRVMFRFSCISASYGLARRICIISHIQQLELMLSPLSTTPNQILLPRRPRFMGRLGTRIR